MFDFLVKLLELFADKVPDDDSNKVFFIIFGIVIALFLLRYFYKLWLGVDEFFIKKADKKLKELDAVELILCRLKQNDNSIFRHKAYEILFKKSVSYIEIEYLDLIMKKYKDKNKTFRCLISSYPYIDRNVKDEIKEKVGNNCFNKLKPKFYYNLMYFIFSLVSLTIFCFFPQYLYQELFIKVFSSKCLCLLISYSLSSIIAIPLFCIAKDMVDKLSAISNLEWLSNKSNKIEDLDSLKFNDYSDNNESPCYTRKEEINTSSFMDKFKQFCSKAIHF